MAKGQTPKPRSKASKGAKPHRSSIEAAQISRPDRRHDILISSELLFSERGYHAVSVRDIADKAGVPLALVGYYFGRKEELYRTIFEHRRAYITRRIESIAQIDCSARNAVEKIVRAWAQPVMALRASEHGEHFSVLVARASLDSSIEVNRVTNDYYEPVVQAFVDAMCKALPACTRDQVIWGYEFALGALMLAVADHRLQRRLTESGFGMDHLDQLDPLVGFLTAGFKSLTKHASIARPKAAKNNR